MGPVLRESEPREDNGRWAEFVRVLSGRNSPPVGGSPVSGIGMTESCVPREPEIGAVSQGIAPPDHQQKNLWGTP